MAMAKLAENLKEELTCPVYMDYFSHPVNLGCGHSFCQPCLLRTWREVDKSCPCPECRRAFQIKDLESNHCLGKLSSLARNIRPYLLQLRMERAICERHQEEQKLFCEEDQTLHCVSCFESQEHSRHTVHLIEMAAEDSRDKLQKTLDLLWKEVEMIQNMLTEERQKMETWNEQADAWRESIRAEYKRLYEFLKCEEKWHLQNLSRDESKNIKNLRESETRLSQHLQSLKEIIIDLEQNGQKPDLQLLKVGGGTLKRIKSLLSHRPEATIIQVSMAPITGIWEMMKHFRVNVTLDPESACPYLIVSENMKTVTHRGYQQYIPVAPHQFEDSIILGAQVFTFGMHYWEVNVGESRKWAVGVCKASLSRNASVSLSTGDVFLLTHFQKRNTYSMMTTPFCIEYHSNSPIQKVGIFLGYDQGSISFYDALKNSLIFRFPAFPFSDPLKPIFCPCPPRGEENGIPMTIDP
ncbi:probable E3 ubiquitin-protein ligase TRIML1 [Monodelphis domestica]|uniref:Tripartite motif containing 62 n=1 Tax=Monodelphis domestica TaxID=13616 RepID=F6STE0_MONDO|nr:probable E3 ubiquitin-protein ligase TRIML1 [Monodelphis domestica]XP_056668165.1 probable E3 ubiquitin-protein ligase TRIML1 [Monodelphis domestica]